MHDSVTVHMAAPPERVWDLVSDVTRIGSYSPETFEAEWIEGATGPAVGARFRGHVKRNGIGPIYWTTCTVSECEPGKTFAFGVGAAGKRPLNVWRYDIAPADGGSDVTESFTLSPTFGLRLYWAAVGVVPRQGESQGHAHHPGADPGRGGSRAGGVGVEDRPGTLLHLELGDASPQECATRAGDVAQRQGVERVTWWENCAFGRTDLPMRIPDGRTLLVVEADERFEAPSPTARGLAVPHLPPAPPPSQGILTGGPTLGLLIVWISPRTPELAPGLRDWGDFVHIRHIAAGGHPGFHADLGLREHRRERIRSSCTSTSSTTPRPRPPSPP